MKTLNKEDKWLLASCLQKSIRKGFSNLAVSYAEKLYNLEKSFLYNFLIGVAIEDIGIGNIELIYNLINENVSKEITQNKEMLLRYTFELSESIKDRTASDLIKLTKLIKNNNLVNVEEIYLNKNEALLNRVLAGWEILGAEKFQNDLIKNKADNLVNFLEITKSLIKDERIYKIIEYGYTYSYKMHFLTLGLLSQCMDLEADISIGKFKTGDYVEVKHDILIVDDWLIDGIDRRIKEGRMAISNFIHSNNKTIAYLVDNKINQDDITEIIGELLFRKMGQHVNKRLVYPTAIKIMKQAERELLRINIKDNNVDLIKLNTLFNEELSILNDNIKKVFLKPDPTHFPF